MKKSGLAAAALTGILIASFSAIPAQAVGGPVLPSNQNLYVLDCDSYGGNLWSVDPASGASTRVDTGTPVDRCGGGGQTNPVDGLTYFVYYHGSTYLATADTTSGVISKVADFNGATSSPWSIAITNAGADTESDIKI